ncbi:YncE family protein, partial [Streptomyces sp. NPDC050256]
MSARRAVLLLAAAAVLAGCATEATGAPDGSAAAKSPAGTPSASAPAGRTPDGTLLVADFGGDTVTFVDPERGAFDRVEVGTAPYGLVVGADGRAWVATAEGVAVVDTKSRTRQARIPYGTETGPVTTGEYRGGGMGIALAPDGRHV